MPLVIFILLLILWQFVAAGIFHNSFLFPPPLQVVKGLWQLSANGRLMTDIGTSLLRFFAGYLLAAVLAIPLGLILGWYHRAWRAIDPLVQFLRPISPIAWFPLIALWFGIGELPAIVIIFIAAFFPLLLSTAAAVRQVNPLYIKVARNFGSSERALLWKVVIPASFPQIAMGLHLALGTAWVFLVAGEMLGVNSGLGFLIVDARNALRTDLVLGGILVIGVLGLLLDRAVGRLEKHIKERWGMVA